MSKHMPLLAGWDFETWRRALAWAGVDLNPAKIAGDVIAGAGSDQFEQLMAVRTKWLDAGGPQSGPSELLNA